MNRRRFTSAAVSALGLAGAPFRSSAGVEEKKDLPFDGQIKFANHPIALKVKPFPLSSVHLLPGVLHDCEQANRAYLKRLDPDRLLHNFRVNAGLASSARALGGWEKPDCELRGHFAGHYLSACALTYSSTSDSAIKHNGDYFVSELAKCQEKLGGGYLSAFPISYFDRLNARIKVWAPFYTVHKIMAGLLDMHTLAGNAQALTVVAGMAGWADAWTAAIPEEAHLQQVLDTEYGGMNDLLYRLAEVTGNDHFAAVGDRFTKKKFFNPLALRRDELRGLHVNTHIPQVIGAAKRYELSGDMRFRDVADFFWWDVTTGRAYVTGGTSNNESWLEEPRHLGAELRRATDSTEDCCAYNLLKLTRHLYTWTADPRYFDYYERVLWNHRVPAMDRRSGATQYYLSLSPAAWKTFNTETDSFWCCTGTGVEDFSKLNDSIYFHDDHGIYVNLFVPSELRAADFGLVVKQTTRFPESPVTTFSIQEAPTRKVALHMRIPWWAGSDAALAVNGRPADVTPFPASYLTLNRKWNAGDIVTLTLPMRLSMESMPDEPQTQAFLYGPLVLAGQLGSDGITEPMTVGPMGPDLKHHPMEAPALKGGREPAAERLKPKSGQPLAFTAESDRGDITFAPFYQTFGQRYSIYWTVA